MPHGVRQTFRSVSVLGSEAEVGELPGLDAVDPLELKKLAAGVARSARLNEEPTKIKLCQLLDARQTSAESDFPAGLRVEG